MMAEEDRSDNAEVTVPTSQPVSFDNEETLGKAVVEKKLICNLGCGAPILNLETRL